MANILIAEQLPLQGQHLIEASAGTGKTFNITRIYLRLLLGFQLFPCLCSKFCTCSQLTGIGLE